MSPNLKTPLSSIGKEYILLEYYTDRFIEFEYWADITSDCPIVDALPQGNQIHEYIYCLN